MLGLLSDYLWGKYGTVVINQLSSDLFNHINFLPLSVTHKYNIGDMIARFNVDIRAIENGLVYAIPAAVTSFIGVIISSFLLFQLNSILFITSIAGVILSVLSPRIIHKKALHAEFEKEKYIGTLTSFLQEKLSAQIFVKSYWLQKYMNNQYDQNLNTFLGIATKSYFFAYFSMRLPNLIFLLSNILILGIGVWLTLEKKFTIGGLASFQVLFLTLSTYIDSMTYFIPSLISSRAALYRVNEILNEKNNIQDIENPYFLTGFHQKIEFKNVNFGYVKDQHILQSLNFEIPQGKFVSIMGHSGAGKSSIANLLLRLYDIDSGEITIDNYPIQEISLSSLRQQIGFVSQEIFMFNRTVEENIILGNLNATKEEIIQAAKSADIHELIMSLPEQYLTKCGEKGNRFSGGEKQRISLARALIRNPSILILDEATSALDPISELAIMKTLHKLKKRFTIIAITHKVRLANESDLVYVIEGGKIVENGRPNELIKSGGVYEQFFRTQN